MDYTYEQISKMIDHSLLNPTLTAEDLEQGIQIALDYNVGSACIMPFMFCAPCCQISWRRSRIS